MEPALAPKGRGGSNLMINLAAPRPIPDPRCRHHGYVIALGAAMACHIGTSLLKAAMMTGLAACAVS